MTDKPFKPKRVVDYAVGLETYHTRPMGQMPPVLYARADAEAFVAAMRDLWSGRVAEFEDTILLNAEASLTRIKDDLAYLIHGLDADDLFVFYYAVHGFHGAGGNRLTGADTNMAHLETTTALVKDTIMVPLEASACAHSLLFIDACAVDLIEASIARDVIASMSADEYKTFLEASEYSSVFLSCKPKERSYSCHSLKHGVWTWHLVQALLGKAGDAIDAQRWVTDGSLRAYLTNNVRSYVRDVLEIPSSQTPQAWITATGSVPIRHVPVPTIPPPPTDLSGFALVPKKTSMLAETGGLIRHLSGYRSGHSVPTKHTSGASDFVGKLLAEDVADEGRSTLKRIQDATGLRLSDIEVVEDRAAYELIAERFEFSITGDQDPDDPTRWRTTTRLDLGEKWAVLGKKLDAAFGPTFKTLQVQIERPTAPHADLVDQMEDLKTTFGGTVTDEREIIAFESDELDFSINLARPAALLRFKRKYSLLGALEEARRWHMPLAD